MLKVYHITPPKTTHPPPPPPSPPPPPPPPPPSTVLSRCHILCYPTHPRSGSDFSPHFTPLPFGFPLYAFNFPELFTGETGVEGVTEVFVGDVGIDLCRSDGSVPEEVANIEERGTVIEKMGRKGVTQGVRRRM